MNINEIPYTELLREVRRRQKEGNRPKGRPRKPRPCPKCGAKCLSTNAALAHCANREAAL